MRSFKVNSYVLSQQIPLLYYTFSFPFYLTNTLKDVEEMISGLEDKLEERSPSQRKC